MTDRPADLQLTTALGTIPPTYAEALRLAVGGVPDHEIAERLGVDPHAVPMLLRLADAKLDRAMEELRARR
jgi:DNA-directed RNA polymerase specialized sigma24 family protein